jgi:LmbE family N-acetylglucosaminyl deacetylase
MLGIISLLLLSIILFGGGLISLFAGRKLYPVWLGFATYYFVTRILDMALFRYSDTVRNWGGVVIALIVTVIVILLRDRVIRYIPPIGGFLVSALIAERLLGIVFPDAGKFLFFGVLVLGGILGVILFRKRLGFDDSIIVLSALWGAANVSTLLFDIVDVFLITFVGALGSTVNGFLNVTHLLQTLIWIGLTIVGIFVQRRIGFKPIPLIGNSATPDKEKMSRPQNRRKWLFSGLIGIVVIFILGNIASSNDSISKNIHRSLTRLEHSLGIEAEAPGDAPWQWASTLIRPQLTLEENDRILLLVPHPDDDILSGAGLVQQAVEKDLPVKVVYFTNGDFNETSFELYRKEITLDPVEALRLGETRREEALSAQSILGIKPEQVIFLGYPDGGGREIFEKHWNENPPYRAILSGMTSVPYIFAQSHDAPYKGESILADLEKIVSDFQPTKIITSHPGDVHPDHQTLPLYLKIALWNLGSEISPEVYHFITHYGMWPQPRGYQPEHPLEPPAQYDVNNRWHILPLSVEERENKLLALQAHKTQWGSGQPYLESVVRANELFDVVGEITVPPGQEVQILSAQTAFNGEALQLLPESEQNMFTDSEVRSVKIDGDELVFAIESEQPLEGDVHARIWTMGYRSETPFGAMPKIYMDLSSDGYKVYDQGKELPGDSVQISGTPTRSEVRIPLELLGNPERLMVSAQTSIGDVPLDNIPWVYLNLNQP